MILCYRLFMVRIKPSLAADVWSFGTTLWEIFNSGEPPLPGMPPLEAATKYIAGERLQWPGASVHLAQVATNAEKLNYQYVPHKKRNIYTSFNYCKKFQRGIIKTFHKVGYCVLN
jgi:hypothetical protein